MTTPTIETLQSQIEQLSRDLARQQQIADKSQHHAEQLTIERDKWKQVALDYDDEICDWKNASGLSGETVDLTHEMLASKLSQLTKRAEAAEADCAAMREVLQPFADRSSGHVFPHCPCDACEARKALYRTSGATLLARLKSLEGALRGASKLIVQSQNILAEYIVPDSGISETEAINRLLEVMDGEQQRQAQASIQSALKVSTEGGG